jgi:transcriptional regulator with XRE-family HTH domain
LADCQRIATFGRTVEQTWDDARKLVRQAIHDGELPARVDAAQIRSFLRGRRVACTLSGARRLLEALIQDDLQGSYRETAGSRLASARRARGLTRVELARIAGCSESYLSYLESDARSPSDRLLVALGEAVRKEPEWLRSGEDSPDTRRIAEELRLAWMAFRSGNWEILDEHLDHLLSGTGRPLTVPERDTVLMLRGRRLSATGREQEAIGLLAPLVQRVLSGLSQVSPVVLGQGYVRALLEAADGSVELLARAWIVGQRLLSAAGGPRTDDWWRLAATLMNIHFSVSPADLAAAEGEIWLAELREQGEQTSPSGAAALYWNLALTDLALGRREPAMIKIVRAVALQNPRDYPTDGARLGMVHAAVLLETHPEQAGEAVHLLDQCRDAVRRYGYPGDAVTWELFRARAEVAAGLPASAATMLGRLLGGLDQHSAVRVEALILQGDAWRRDDRAGEAIDAYEKAAATLAAAPATPSWAQLWRALGDRWTALSRAAEAADAYRQALDLMHLTGP